MVISSFNVYQGMRMYNALYTSFFGMKNKNHVSVQIQIDWINFWLFLQSVIIYIRTSQINSLS